VAAAPAPVPLGTVGQISFWAPNRGLLITGGSEAAGGIVPAGLYAYDGVSWHQLASECGGAKGRIAWAGPDEFWTIADQRAGQVTSSEENQGELEALSLCHFVGDQVVASYAMPLGQPESYVEMDAAACLNASDCWFAGQDGGSPQADSFHLHWDGSQLTASYDSSDHEVASLTSFQGKFYEGLTIDEEDTYLPGEEPVRPPAIRTIAPAGQTQLCSGVQSSFCNSILFSLGQQLPQYAERSAPDALGGLQLASDGSPLGTGATQLWAAADPDAKTPTKSGTAKLTILRDAKGSWTQIAPTPAGVSPLGSATLEGSRFDVSATRRDEAAANAIAPEPGEEAAWLSLEDGSNSATVARLQANGTLQVEHLPTAQEPVGFRGHAGPIACPASHECWLATGEGWLFHLTTGDALPANTDPLFDGADGVISYRPADSGVPQIYPDGFAEDDSLVNQQQQAAPVQPPQPPPVAPSKAKKAKPLVTHMKTRFVHGRVLVITFTLTAKAHVQMIARRHGRTVAATRNASLRVGRHTISLSLDPRHWPTRLQFLARPVGGNSPAQTGAGSSESGDTTET
jgi:hypothetical protein